MDQMGESVPIGDMLRIFRTLHHAVPKFHITAGADWQPPHRKQDRGLQREQADGVQSPVPTRKHGYRGSVTLNRHGLRTISSAAPSGVSTMRSLANPAFS